MEGLKTPPASVSQLQFLTSHHMGGELTGIDERNEAVRIGKAFEHFRFIVPAMQACRLIDDSVHLA